MYTIKTAAEATGKTKSSILRAIQKGRISGTRTDSGEWIIDPAELHRVYPPLPRTDADTAPEHQDAPPALAALEMENRMLREQLAREREVSADLARRLDAEAEERRRLTYVLTHQPTTPAESAEEPPKPSRPSLVEKLFGRWPRD